MECSTSLTVVADELLALGIEEDDEEVTVLLSDELRVSSDSAAATPAGRNGGGGPGRIGGGSCILVGGVVTFAVDADAEGNRRLSKRSLLSIAGELLAGSTAAGSTALLVGGASVGEGIDKDPLLLCRLKRLLVLLMRPESPLPNPSPLPALW